MMALFARRGTRELVGGTRPLPGASSFRKKTTGERTCLPDVLVCW
jgi:hypothetical protein